jgi:group I intron endonuclease
MGGLITGLFCYWLALLIFTYKAMKKRDCKNELEELYFEIGEGVYCIQNKHNDAVYFGNTNNLRSRYQKHLWYLRRGTHPNKDLQKDYIAFDEDAFTFTIIHASQSKAKRHNLERMLISQSREEGLRLYNVRTPAADRYQHKNKELLEEIVKQVI